MNKPDKRDPDPEGLVAFLERRMAEVGGRLEWLGTDLQKKGAIRKAERGEQLILRFDEICRRLEALEPVLGAGDVPAPLDADLRSNLARVERLVLEATEDGAAYTDEQGRRISEGLDALEATVAEGERTGRKR